VSSGAVIVSVAAGPDAARTQVTILRWLGNVGAASVYASVPVTASVLLDQSKQF
jgi:hypothetical protein